MIYDENFVIMSCSKSTTDGVIEIDNLLFGVPTIYSILVSGNTIYDLKSNLIIDDICAMVNFTNNSIVIST